MSGLGCPNEIQPHARKLLALASGRWTPAEIRGACEANGWALAVEQAQNKGLSFRIERELRLVVVFEPIPGVPTPHCQIVLYLHAPGNYPERDFPEFAWEDFDQAFEASLDALEAELGEAEAYGVHNIGWAPDPRVPGWASYPHYSYAIWRGWSGLLVLQQEEYDLYCGQFAVSMYLHPWEEGRPAPRLPLAFRGQT
jgi:hypothetical protein